MRLQLTDKDLKSEAKNKSIEDISVFDFKEGEYLKARVTPLIHLVEYAGEKGIKVFKDFLGERGGQARSETITTKQRKPMKKETAKHNEQPTSERSCPAPTCSDIPLSAPFCSTLPVGEFGRDAMKALMDYFEQVRGKAPEMIHVPRELEESWRERNLFDFSETDRKFCGMRIQRDADCISVS